MYRAKENTCIHKCVCTYTRACTYKIEQNMYIHIHTYVRMHSIYQSTYVRTECPIERVAAVQRHTHTHMNTLKHVCIHTHPAGHDPLQK